MSLRSAFRISLYCICLFTTTNQAFCQTNTTRAYSFGDSLTDNTYAYLFFPDLPLDPTIYGADPFEAVFNKAAVEGDLLEDFAIAGSTSADVLAAVEYYVAARSAGAIEPATLVSVQGGGNDFLTVSNLFALGSAAPGESEAIDQIVDGVKNNLMKAMRLLRKSDQPQIIVWTVPDVTLTPYILSFGLDATTSANVRAHIERLNNFIRAQGNRPDVAVLDASYVFNAVTFQPLVILNVELFPTPYFGFATAIFADPIHPTAVGNGLLANDLIQSLNDNFDDTISFYSEAELGTLAGIE